MYQTKTILNDGNCMGFVLCSYIYIYIYIWKQTTEISLPNRKESTTKPKKKSLTQYKLNTTFLNNMNHHRRTNSLPDMRLLLLPRIMCNLMSWPVVFIRLLSFVSNCASSSTYFKMSPLWLPFCYGYHTIFNSELINAFFYCSILPLSVNCYCLGPCVSIQNLTFLIPKRGYAHLNFLKVVSRPKSHKSQ